MDPKDLKFVDLKKTAKGAKRKKSLRKVREVLEVEQTPPPPTQANPKIIPLNEWSRMKSWLKELRRSVSEQVQQAHENQNERVLVECDLGAQEAESQLETLLIKFPGSRESILAFQGAARDIRSALVQISRDRTMVKENLLQQKQLLEEQSLNKKEIPPSKVTTTTTVTEVPSSPPITVIPPPAPAAKPLTVQDVLTLIEAKAKEKPPEPKVKVIRQRKPAKQGPASNPTVQAKDEKNSPSPATIAGFESEFLLLLQDLSKNPKGIDEKFDTLGLKVAKEMDLFPGNQDLARIYGQIKGILDNLPKAEEKEEPKVVEDKKTTIDPQKEKGWQEFMLRNLKWFAWGAALIALALVGFFFGPNIMSRLKSYSQPVAKTGGYKIIPVPPGLGDTNSSTSASGTGGTNIVPITITPTPASAGPSISVSGTSGNSNVITSTIYNFIDNSTGVKENSVAQPSKGWPEVCTLETVDLDPRLHHKKPFKLSPGESRKFRIPLGWNVKTFSYTHQELFSIWEGGRMNRSDISRDIDSSCTSLFNDKLKVELEFWFEFEDRRLPDQR